NPALTVMGDSMYRMQRIAIEHVAEGFVQALLTGASVGQTYEVAGPRAYRFVEILDQIDAALGGARVRKIHVPLGVVRLAAQALQWLPFFPLRTDQLTMLEEESVTDPSRFYADLGISPESFEE